ncbi:MAG: Ppx/GppA family phosphatase [Gammaproteobacteria bacterium]|nr:Ppx/GppA family phosphatase [Gammaproteobacteria bacterium]NNJ72895.1 Ppx/GppA family phosphatase [Enterobacterales bacterium]
MQVAALDIGSNSFNLLIANTTDSNFKQIARVKQKVQLGAGLDADNNLSQQAIERGMACLRDFLPILNKHGVGKLYCAATNALRLANNRKEFIYAAETLLMQPIEIISGEREAQYIYQAVQHEFNFSETGLVIDIGGGSTEFAFGSGATVLADNCYSVQAGCVSYSNHYFADGKIYPENMSAAVVSCRHELESIGQSFKTAKAKHILGTSGSVQSIAIVLQEVLGSDVSLITLTDLETLMVRLTDIGDVSATRFQSLDENRLKILPAGVCILTAIMRYLEIQQLTVAQAALCEGLLLSHSNN